MLVESPHTALNDSSSEGVVSPSGKTPGQEFAEFVKGELVSSVKITALRDYGKLYKCLGSDEPQVQRQDNIRCIRTRIEDRESDPQYKEASDFVSGLLERMRDRLFDAPHFVHIDSPEDRRNAISFWIGDGIENYDPALSEVA